MNIIIIEHISQLMAATQGPMYLSGTSSSLDQEICQNMWALSFKKSMHKQLTLATLNNFLEQLLKAKSQEISHSHAGKAALFYLWFDEQALQLRFNFISIQNKKLPFNCKLKLVDSPEPIFKNLMQSPQKIEIIELLGSADDDTSEEIDDFVLTVYTRVMNG